MEVSSAATENVREKRTGATTWTWLEENDAGKSNANEPRRSGCPPRARARTGVARRRSVSFTAVQEPHTWIHSAGYFPVQAQAAPPDLHLRGTRPQRPRATLARSPPHPSWPVGSSATSLPRATHPNRRAEEPASTPCDGGGSATRGPDGTERRTRSTGWRHTDWRCSVRGHP